MAVEAAGFPEQIARRVQNMAADVGQDELIEFLEERLIVKDRKAVAVVDARPKHSARCALRSECV